MDVRRSALAVLLSVCAAATSHAQTPPSSALPSRPVFVPALGTFGIPLAADQQLRILQLWTHDYQEWKAWYLQWRNRPEPGVFSSRARREPPAPPAWLPAFCATLFEESGAGADACAAWREWQADDVAATLMTEQIAQTRAANEAPVNTKWWERVHVDALWPMTRAGSSAFGVAGVHTTLHVTKRFQVFLAPGFILMRTPALDGSRTWSAAADWGFSYGLFDVRLPFAARPATVHLNMARVWVLGGEAVAMRGEMYLAGFSLSFKQR